MSSNKRYTITWSRCRILKTITAHSLEEARQLISELLGRYSDMDTFSCYIYDYSIDEDDMSLDIIFTERYQKDYSNSCGRIVEVGYDDHDKDYFINITHNLNIMADHVPIGERTLYDVLWRGDELPDPIIKGRQFEDYLYIGIDYLAKHKEILVKYNPSNGWGNYESLLHFTKECLALSIQHPDAEVRFSR